MKLAQLFTIFPHLKMGDAAFKEVSNVCFDSRKLEAGCVFVAIRGLKADGHDFVAQAAKQGAIALVVEDKNSIPNDFPGAIIVTDDTRTTLNRLAAKFYGEPSHRLFCVGVTGTNGKTTTTHMIEAILNEFGWPTGVIGTINHHLGQQVWQSEMTTPDPMSFQRRLHEFETMGARAVAMEVSSHALSQARVDEVPFDVAVFTNLTRDHLDYHKNMEDYFQAKARLFQVLLQQSSKPARFAIINKDDEFGRRLSADGATIWTFGSNEADFVYKILEMNFNGTRFLLNTPQGEAHIHLPMVGSHNVENASAALAVGLAAGAHVDTCVAALEKFKGVSGRLESVPNNKGVHVFIDYAHTDAAIAGILKNLNNVRSSSQTQNRIITVFGCGGDRDRGKRPLMMKAALDGSDLVILTSDNPRTEDPKVILEDALAGASSDQIKNKVKVEVDRKKALALALQEAKSGDVVLVAGKGHETYQQIGKQKFPFSDFEVVSELCGK
jgi:UDP-N-acetylmuramoyl-L-alanyl-D-glutamate--2,6-diaminopimelate ligase